MALEKRGLSAYVPMRTTWIESVQSKQKMKREIQRAMLPGYVFVCVPDDSGIWYEMRQQHRDGQNIFGINGVVTNNGKACRVSTHTLKQLSEEERAGWFDDRAKRRLLAESNPEMAGPSVRTGDSVSIREGAFAAFMGVAEADSASGQVRALITIFGRETLVVVPIDQVQNHSRNSLDDMATAARLTRAGSLSDLARSQSEGLADWRTIEDRRRARMDTEIRAQTEGQRPLKQAN